MLCPQCKLTARQRILIEALRDSLRDRHPGTAAILEQLSRLHRRITREFPAAKGSEFLSDRHLPGSHHLWASASRPWLPRIVRHESILALSYGTNSLKFLAHTDVLEHVSDTRKALQECRRVLSHSCHMIFTVHFFTDRPKSVIRGYFDASGALVELLPGEYHGDGLKSRGIHTFHNFGWGFLEELESIFGRAEIGFAHAPNKGFLYADSARGDWNMAPIVFRVQKL